MQFALRYPDHYWGGGGGGEREGGRGSSPHNVLHTALEVLYSSHKLPNSPRYSLKVQHVCPSPPPKLDEAL